MKKKIFITGANSFIGKRLIYFLLQKNYEIFGVDLSECIILGVKIKKVDIRSSNLEKYIPNNCIVVHLAAVSSEQQAKKDTQEVISINVNGTNNLIECCKKKKIKNLIFASSEWIYGSYNKDTIIKESSNIINYKNDSLYAATKLIGEKLLANSLDKIKNIKILRFGIIYGPKDSNFGIIENFVVNSIKKNKISINSKKSARRYIYIDDIVSAIIHSIDIKGLKIFNVSGNKLVTLGQIFIYLEKILKYRLNIKENNKSFFNIRNISNSNIKKNTKWKPKYSFQEGLKTLVKYYKHD